MMGGAAGGGPAAGGGTSAVTVQGGGIESTSGQPGDVVWVYELNLDKNYHLVPAQILEITLDVDGIVK